ncbi:Agenet domain-containing protein [Abeliophyllum distichum]|uniref:Agenet domain-containing protein n=1 Tax=Abeliophyllum distichum TaxID=126358 RepID=A0ABD1RFS1_9LAMI
MAGNVEADPFKKGAQVEVSLEDDGFRGVLPLREAVDPILVRPIPPREARRRFHVSEDVDAFHNDGWWEGIVITALDGGRYSVFFRSSREQIEFDESQLRLHREWVYGKWVPPLEAVNDDSQEVQKQPEQKK